MNKRPPPPPPSPPEKCTAQLLHGRCRTKPLYIWVKMLEHWTTTTTKKDVLLHDASRNIWTGGGSFEFELSRPIFFRVAGTFPETCECGTFSRASWSWSCTVGSSSCDLAVLRAAMHDVEFTLTWSEDSRRFNFDLGCWLARSVGHLQQSMLQMVLEDGYRKLAVVLNGVCFHCAPEDIQTAAWSWSCQIWVLLDVVCLFRVSGIVNLRLCWVGCVFTVHLKTYRLLCVTDLVKLEFCWMWCVRFMYLKTYILLCEVDMVKLTELLLHVGWSFYASDLKTYKLLCETDRIYISIYLTVLLGAACLFCALEDELNFVWHWSCKFTVV